MRGWTQIDPTQYARSLNGAELLVRPTIIDGSLRWTWSVNGRTMGNRPSAANACAAASWYARHRANTAPAVDTVGEFHYRRFGVEIEVAGISGRRCTSSVVAQRIHDALTVAGVPVVNEIYSYNHRVPAAWAIRPDGSLASGGVELVSPPMSDLAQLEVVTRTLRSIGVKVDRRCGLHVHVDVHEASLRQLFQVRELYTRVNGSLNMVFPESRRYNHFCSRERARTWIETVYTPTNINEGNRYVPVNLTSFVKYGTVEFRQHQGTLNFTKVKNWVELVQRHVAWAMANPEAELSATYSRDEYYDLIQPSTACRQHLERRATHA